ncbi:MAG TPA: class I SAM-dependent methyltransferase [Dongiaceae bacterium]|jgi:SAM-dependent methyltransferase
MSCEKPAPSAWVLRHAGLVPAGRPVLDLACGSGRHSLVFLAAGHPVTGADRDLSGVAALAGSMDFTALQIDLETGEPWPLGHGAFGGVVVTNYLHRPILADIVAAVEPGGALIYETFAAGNEAFGKPSNPDFLLRPGELLEAVRGLMDVVAYEHLTVSLPKPAKIQRLAAMRR